MKRAAAGNNGQSTLEIIITLVAIGTAMVMMYPYIRSALSSRYKSGVDSVGHGMLYWH